MKPRRPKENSMLLTVGESLCNLALLPLSLPVMFPAMYAVSMAVMDDPSAGEIDAQTIAFLQDTVTGSSAPLLLTAMLFVLALSRFFHAYRNRSARGKAVFVTTLCQGAVFAACGIYTNFSDFAYPQLTLVSVAHAAAVSAGIIVSLIRDHRLRRLIPGILTILALVLTASVCFATYPFVALWAFTALMGFTFMRLNLKMLGNIIRKTYASEIIFGLLILIFTFSYLLIKLEPGMPAYWDAVWYCFAIVTTIGFGDITAVTLPGRILSVILGIYGIIVVALITSIIVNFYGEMKKGGSEDEPQTAPSDASSV